MSVSAPLNQWFVVVSHLQVKSDFKTTKTTIYVGTSGQAPTTNSLLFVTSACSFTKTDQIRIGGTQTFIGQINSVRIYTPGSAFLSSMSC